VIWKLQTEHEIRINEQGTEQDKDKSQDVFKVVLLIATHEHK